MSHSTVVEQKHAFIRRQKQILTKGIPLSNRLLKIADQGGIPQKVLGDVLLKVNRDLKRHGRTVYSSQLSDHIVDQIDLVYYEAGSPNLDDEGEVQDPDLLYQGDNLTLDENIEKLPTTWDISADAENTLDDGRPEVDQDDYIDAVARLQDLSARRLTLQQKLNTYRTLLSLLEPYCKPQENIQPNLVGRDAPLALELGQTRTLAIRVAGRISEKLGDVQVPASDDGDDVLMIEDDGDAKVKKILANW